MWLVEKASSNALHLIPVGRSFWGREVVYLGSSLGALVGQRAIQGGFVQSVLTSSSQVTQLVPGHWELTMRGQLLLPEEILL